ncbi:hypothetical protein LOTGIDRAFT_171232 [Lottia gigantea]|uniref:Centrosome and spindle pole-associated protein 1 C-terminal domain-containing protein n=1 Tax=Lottia gigantea TaxID=225164 RepID=V4BBY7_LOTGI|nr:hypothetical protein LOTGIDRAFT_171232 [Lottia gigantea]ESP03587.1 hypothetical protein LOTGIDRAFT_171232 [Lottia gigantea]
MDVETYNDGGYNATLLIGESERSSAKRRRQEDYKQDLELQMREKNAARQREKLQDMRVNASGWLDPEKGPERLKPLGGHDFMTTKRVRESRAKPYHTLFALDQPRKLVAGQATIVERPQVQVVSPPVERRRPPLKIISPRPRVNKIWARERGARSPMAMPNLTVRDHSPPPPLHVRASSVPAMQLIEPPRRSFDIHPGIFYQPPAYPQQPMGMSYQPMYDMPASAPVNLVPPLTINQTSPRPLIINHQPIDSGHSPRYNPFQNDSGIIELKSVLQMSMKERARISEKRFIDLDKKLENERMRARLERENADHRRKLDRDREAEMRRARDQEAEHRRRMEELRREAEERRRQAERDRREAERLRLLALRQPRQEAAPNPDIRIIQPKSPDLYDIRLYRNQLREERRKIEALLNRKSEPNKGMDLRVIKQKRQQYALPKTPSTADLANRQNVAIFTDLKHREIPARKVFRGMFPEVPYTNKKLEWQQAALLKQQEQTIRGLQEYQITEEHYDEKERRRKWLEMYPWTPNITTGHYGRIQTSRSLDGYGDRSYRSYDDYDTDGLRLRGHR